MRLTFRDAAPESYQVTPESLGNFEPSLIRIKQGEKRNDAIRNQISDLEKRRISQPKKQ